MTQAIIDVKIQSEPKVSTASISICHTSNKDHKNTNVDIGVDSDRHITVNAD